MSKICASYHVGLKILLKKEDKFLFLNQKKCDWLDLPGGRIDEDEHATPLASVIDREIKEELGGAIAYKLGKPAVQFRRSFPHKNLHIFITVYEAEYLAGAVELSHEHDRYEWMSAEDVVSCEKHFFNQEEYRAFKDYFG